jgi:hypothetical protein
MQHFLKSAAGAAWTEIIPAQFLEELLLVMDEPETRALLSDGNPLRRLLLGSKKNSFSKAVLLSDGLPVTPEGEAVR